jgi:hypothetical protein
MTLSPNDFPFIKDYLSKFKTLGILCIECQLDLKKDRCIYVILSKLGSAYFVFISTFHVTKEDLGSAYDPGGYRRPPTFSKWLKTIFWPFWQFTIFSRFSLPGPF